MSIPQPPHARVAGLLSLALLASLPAATPVQAAWPGENGAIAFSRNGANGRAAADIWVRGADGTQRRLTSGPGSDTEPTYSRDGRLIAFVRYSNSGSDIWMMKSDGTNERPVTATEEHDQAVEPAFFPSGHSLAFAVQGIAGGPAVFSIRIDGSGLQRQADRAKSPVVSPDGRRLAFWRHPGGNRIRLKDLGTGAERQLPTGSAQEPDFSPDGRRLVFVGKRPCRAEGEPRQALLTIGLNEKRPRMLLDTCRRKFIPFGPAWSPGGNRIAFTYREDGEASSDVGLQMLNLRGTLVPGAPRHRPGTFETAPTWQPLP